MWERPPRRRVPPPWAPPPARRAGVGPGVPGATLRPPAMLRAAFDTLDRIAPGRIIAGIGAGDDESLPEDSAFGVLPGDPVPGTPVSDPAGAPPSDPSPTAGRPVHAGPVPGALDPKEAGRYRLARLGATVDALAGRDYPVWVAGSTPAAIRLAAARAGGWNLWGATPDRFAVAAARVRAELAAAGRDPSAFTAAGRDPSAFIAAERDQAPVAAAA